MRVFISEIREDLNAVGATQTDITDKNTFRHKGFDRKVGQMDKRKKTGRVLSVLRKRALSEKMQQACAQRKNKPIMKVFRCISRSPVGSIR